MPPFARLGCLVLIAVALCSASTIHAQYVDASAAGEPVKLTAPWRFHEGDDPAWAAPDFDDSKWPLIAPDKDTQEGPPADIRYGWYRIRVKLPATQQPLALSIGPVECEVYADGRLIGTVGTMRPKPQAQFMDAVNVIPLPEDLNGRTVTLAVRTVWFFFQREVLSSPSYEPTVAPAGIQWQRRRADSNQILIRLAPLWFSNVLSLCLGMFSLGLFLLDRRSREYGWVALFYVLDPIAYVSVTYLELHHGIGSYLDSLSDGILALRVFALAMFVWGFIGARRGALFKTAMWIYTVWATLAQVQVYYLLGDLLGSQRLGMLVGNVAAFVLLQVFVICLFVRMGISALRGNRNAQLLLIPLTLAFSLGLMSFLTSTFVRLGWMKQTWTFAAVQLGEVPLTWIDIFSCLATASMGLILVLRFAASTKSQQRLSAEMDTARRVQAQLVPAEFPGTQHFRFDAAYMAATEVGGDLYQVYPRADGSVMVLMGDVSGHGLKAAMLGTLLVGAAGAFAQEELTPAQMLSRLNRRLRGHSDGGFVTCLCCLIAPDGALTISNAGHLAPYRNGEEVPCASGLPLGLVPDAEYTEMEFQLREGDTLTFLSDGVVEARNAQGELFGFERAQAISMKPARVIAEQAVAFGQEDDISVLKLTLEPAFVRA